HAGIRHGAPAWSYGLRKIGKPQVAHKAGRPELRELWFGGSDRGVADAVIEMTFFRRRADFFKDGDLRSIEDNRFADPWRRIGFGIGESHVELQVIHISALEALDQNHLVAVWATEMIEPGPVVITGGFDDECVAVPVTDGITVPGGIGILGQLAAIGPDGAP